VAAVRAAIRGIFIMGSGGNPETNKMLPNFERSLKRSLLTLVNRGDVLKIRGEGGQRSPFAYMTVEALTDEPNTDDAKRVFKEMSEAVTAYFSTHSRR